MKGYNTKEEKPEQPRTKRVQLDDFEVHRTCFVSRACMYWLKKIVVEEAHEPV